MSKGLGWNIDYIETRTLHGINGFLNVTTSGQQYNIGEKHSVILYTCINLHAGTPKPQSRNSVSLGAQYILTYEFRTTDSNMVFEKSEIKHN